MTVQLPRIRSTEVKSRTVKTPKGSVEQRIYSNLNSDKVMAALAEVYVTSLLAGRLPKLRPLPKKIRKKLAHGG